MSSPEQPPIFDLPHLADEILEEIFLRIASPADLARASTACVTFRRLVADRNFLRRYRSLHKPPLLGLLSHDGFHPAEPPHRSAAAARALADAADFNFSFLPSPGRWIQQDCRDGRVLLERLSVDTVLSDNDAGEEELVSIDTTNMADLAVCDPVSRRYVILPPIPDDLITSGEQEHLLVFETFLAPAAKEETADTTSFRVVARANYESKVVVFVFSSLTEQWRSSKSVSWSLLTADSWFSATAQAYIWFFSRYYAHGCIYWVMHLVDKLLVFDISKMVFSTINFQWDQDLPLLVILEMDEDMIGAFRLNGDLSGRTQLCYATSRIDADFADGSPLNLDKTIPFPLPLPLSLSLDYCFGIDAATQGYLLLHVWRQNSSGRTMEEDDTNILYFTLEPKTMLLEKTKFHCKDIYRFPTIFVTAKSVNTEYGLFDSMIRTSKGDRAAVVINIVLIAQESGRNVTFSTPPAAGDAMSSPEQPIDPASPGMENTSPPDELLEEIFLRLASPADLARASTACVQALAHAADFNFSFLPTPSHWWRWMPRDWRGGRVLAALVPMAKLITHKGDEEAFFPFQGRDDITDLAVCDPISRRYVILPAIPGDLITSGEQQDCLFDFNAFLAPATEEEMADSSFRVVATAQCKSKLFVFIFSSRSEEWRSFEFDSRSVLAVDASSSVLVQVDFFLTRRYYAHCCLYWVLKEMNKLLVLDTCKMVFFTVDLKRDEHRSHIAILEEAEEDMIGIFSLKTDLGLTTRTQLCYTIRQIKADAANGPPLNLDKIIPLPLPMEYLFDIIDAADGYLLLEGRLLDWFACSLKEGRPDTLYFSLEPKTLVLKRICVFESPIIAAKIYTVAAGLIGKGAGDVGLLSSSKGEGEQHLDEGS
uniref:F-box domain-containing protein n=1 Tax=Oryza punctata TaxID=4537 RepID=A0A0E0LM37_ORYPU